MTLPPPPLTDWASEKFVRTSDVLNSQQTLSKIARCCSEWVNSELFCKIYSFALCFHNPVFKSNSRCSSYRLLSCSTRLVLVYLATQITRNSDSWWFIDLTCLHNSEIHNYTVMCKIRRNLFNSKIRPSDSETQFTQFSSLSSTQFSSVQLSSLKLQPQCLLQKLLESNCKNLGY